MAKNNVIELAGRDTIVDPLTDLLKAGAEKLIFQAVEAELQELLALYSDRRTETGLAGVVRNGFLPARELQTNLGPVTVRIPKVRSKTGETGNFSVGPGATVCEKDKNTGSGAALAVFERCFKRRDGRGTESSCWPASPGLVCEHGIAFETGLGR